MREEKLLGNFINTKFERVSSVPSTTDVTTCLRLKLNHENCDMRHFRGSLYALNVVTFEDYFLTS